MEQNKPLIFFLAIAMIYGARIVSNRIFDKSVHKALWYSVNVPEGWEKKQEEDEVIFIASTLDPMTDAPEAVFSVYAKQPEGVALFLEDFFPQVIMSLRRAGMKILDQGPVLIDGEKAKWVLALNEQHSLLIFSIYVVDEFGRLTKIQFAATKQNFKKYRPKFEEFKDSLKFKKLF